jgi:hypothetical protein
MPVFSAESWCHDCNALVEAEAFPGVDAFERALARLLANGLDDDDRETAKLLETAEDTFLAQQISDWRTRLGWRKNRVSAPRCLTCGSTHIHVLFDESRFTSFADALAGFSHPNCGGTFRRAEIGHGHPSGMTQFDSEGLQLNGESPVA